MRAILLTALANLRRKPGQSLAIGTALALSGLALFVAVALTLGLERPFDSVCRRLNTSPLQLFLDSEIHDMQTVRDWLARQPGVTGVTPVIPVYTTGGNLLHGDAKLEKNLMIAETWDTGGMDRLQVVAHSATAQPKSPAPGDIWITKQLSGSRGIRLGDTIGIPIESGVVRFTVSATVVDPFFSSDNISPSRAWVAPGELAHAFPLSHLSETFLGVGLADRGQAETLRNQLETELGGKLAGWSLTHDLAKMAHGLFFRTMAVALFVAALLALGLSVFIVSSAIGSAVFADYRQIGTLKALGFTPSMVNRIYLIQYLALGLVSIPIGLLGGVLVTQGIFGLLMESLGVVNTNWPAIVPLAVSASAVLATVALSAWWTARKGGRIQPMQAIRFGAPPPRRSGGRWSVPISALPLPAFLGARSLALNPVRAFFSILGMGIAVLVLVFSVNITATFASLGQDRALWGLPAGDVSVRLAGRRFHVRPKVFVHRMSTDARVKEVLAMGSASAEIEGVVGISGRQTSGHAFDGPMTGLGLDNVEGRHPTGPHEIALAVNSAKKGGFALGDAVPLLLEGQRVSPKLVGIYQTANNLGLGFRIDAALMRDLLPIWSPRQVEVVLRENVDPDTFKAELMARYGEAVRVDTVAELSRELARVLGGVRLALVLLSTLLLAVCFTAIYNDTVLSLREQNKTFGILKAAGMTPAQMRMVLVWRTLSVTGISLLLVVPGSLVVLPMVLSAAASGIGLIEFPFVVDALGTALIFPGLLVFGFGCAWIPARGVIHLNPRNLIVE